MIKERSPHVLNKNRKGPIREVLAIVDVDKEGNANILKGVLCPNGCQRPMLAVEESAFDLVREAYWVLVKQSSRKLQLVRFTNVEILEG